MFEFPDMQLPGGILRPMIAVVIEGPSGRRLLDGLLEDLQRIGNYLNVDVPS